MKNRKAFITGITGQDGSYLAELLIEKGYEVYGIMRRNSLFTSSRIDHIFHHPKLFTFHGDLTDSSNLNGLVRDINPDEIYNLGAQSHVAVSFEVPEYTAEVDAMGTLRILDAIRTSKLNSKFYQASTSELYGGLPDTIPQNEQTPFYPKSPYGAAKLYAYWVTVNYREAYNLFACNGILFNHESPRRGETFVTRKITRAIGKIYRNEQDFILLGNLDAKRDWGHAKDYVRAMWLMMQLEKPKDFVIATGETITVREFVTKAFKKVDIDIVWEGKGIDEIGKDQKTNKILVKVDSRYFRPSEVEYLKGDSSLARSELGWIPEYTIDDLIHEMIQADL